MIMSSTTALVINPELLMVSKQVISSTASASASEDFCLDVEERGKRRGGARREEMRRGCHLQQLIEAARSGQCNGVPVRAQVPECVQLPGDECPVHHPRVRQLRQPRHRVHGVPSDRRPFRSCCAPPTALILIKAALCSAPLCWWGCSTRVMRISSSCTN